MPHLDGISYQIVSAAALAAKLCTTERGNTAEALKRQLLLQRGDWVETGVRQALMG